MTNASTKDHLSQKIDTLLEKLWADPAIFADGKNGHETLAELKQSLMRFSEVSPTARMEWACMPQVLECMIELFEKDPAGYADFVEQVVPHSSNAVRLDTREGVNWLYTVLLLLSDDHDYVLDGASPKKYLERYDNLPVHEPLVRTKDVYEALQERLNMLTPVPSVTVFKL